MLNNGIYSNSTGVIRDYKYALYLPDGYSKDAKLPILFFLHGLGEREPHPEGPYVHGPLKLAKNVQSFPFICIAPQCPSDTFWPAEIQTLGLFVDRMTEELGADKSRVYLTGLSMGGFGTWYLAVAYPDKFAAIAPICGAGFEWGAFVLKNVPVWAFHGEEDSVVAVTNSINMVNAVNAAGGNAKITIYPGVGHDSWTKTYENPELYQWMLAQKR